MKHVIAKVTGAGNESVLVTERGVSFGYHDLVVDMRALPMLRELGYPVVFDVTHSLQLPGAGDGVTAGLAQYIEPLASAGVAAGVDAVFMEVHADPSKAKSDAANALRLDRLEPLIMKLKRIDAAARETVGRRLRSARVSRVPASTSRSRARSCRPKPPRFSRSSIASTSASRTAVRILLDCRGRVIVTGMGKSGIICPENRRDAVEHRDAGVLPSSRRRATRRLRRPSGRRRRRRAVVQRRDRRAAAPARDDQARRRATDRDDRRLPPHRSRRRPTSSSTAGYRKKRAR